MPAVQAFWGKLNANERLVGYGAIIVAVAFLLGVFGGGFGTASTDLIGAIAVMVVYWLKYSPTAKINWPAPVETIVLVIAGISAIFALLAILSYLSILFLFGVNILAVIVNAVGCGVMAWGAWKEYQAMPKSAPPAA